MPNLDVSELFTDPDLVASVTYYTRTLTPTNGRAVLTEVSGTLVGSVQAGTGELLLRVPEAVRLEDWITVYTKTRLVPEAAGRYADVVSYGGYRYVVKNVFDWSQWGEGFVGADCMLEPAAK